MRNFIESKKGFEMSFAWIFAIIAGSTIIFLAIYATTKIVQTEQYAQYSEAAVSLGNLLNPVITGIGSAVAKKIDFNKETRIYVGCSNESRISPVFGRQTLSFSEESGFLKKWTLPGANISRHNKYIFSENVMQGKRIFVFAKPFYSGYKVDDLIYLMTDNYCFAGEIPENIRSEITGLNLLNINITSNVRQCSKDSVKVCFGFFISGCDVSVTGDCSEVYCRNSYEKGVVSNGGTPLSYYGTSLMYAAIFSSPEIYKCNVQRLGKKTEQLGKVYADKIEILKLKECMSQIGPDLAQIITISGSLTQSKLGILYNQAKIMDEKNCEAECRVYAPEAC